MIHRGGFPHPPPTAHHSPLTMWPWAMVCGVALGLLVGQVQVIGLMLLAIGVLGAGISIGMDIERDAQRRDGRRLTLTRKGDEP